MFESQKHSFWQALFVTILVFAMGILAGILIENARTSTVSNLYQISEVQLLDLKLQNEMYSGNFDCPTAINENFKLADKIYEEAKTLDKYEEANRFSNSLTFEHYKYDLLRTTLFLNSIAIGKKCSTSYHTVVYFYGYVSPTISQNERQAVFSKLLSAVKEQEGNGVLLIPIAADGDLASINILLKNYNISVSELPVVLIDQDIKLTNIQTKEDILKFLQ